MDGVLVVDKPAGMTSTDVVRVVRGAAGQRRVGHTGTLDPDATGVLVVCLGRATRLVRFLQAGRKTYRAEVTFGIETSTQDTSGEAVREASSSGLTEEAVRDALAVFIGDIDQVPPMFSAVKVDGERLYERARRGETVDREPRRVTVHELVLESFEPGERARATLTVICSSGTYVRTLAHDLGQHLGSGAALAGLRRIANDPFTIDEARTLEAIERAGDQGRLGDLVLSLREAVRALPAVTVDDDAARDVATGRSLPAAGIDGPFAVVLDDDGRLLAIFADHDDDARPEAVFVQPPDLETDAR